ncbi:MAG: poly-gamma-glutamate hydrolase family protein, partial [Acidimicrobiales bacterium]
AAEQAGASLYAVRQPPDLRWHLPSIEVGPDESLALATFLAHVDVAVAIHGYGRDGWWTSLLLGGTHRPLASHLAEHLRVALPGYNVVDELADIPADLRGVHSRNPVNLPRLGGVQLELPPRTRSRTVPMWADLPAHEPIPHQLDLIAGLVAAARSWPTATG